MKKKAEEVVALLDLQPHPEGGFFKEVYRSAEFIPESVLDSKYEGSRNAATSVYFLLTSKSFSAFHRIHQDEIWHFYQGSALELHIITPAGEHSVKRVGNDILQGDIPQVVVPGGQWFGARVIEPDSYSLVGCSVSPGFDFRDFELAKRHQMLQQFPKHEAVIKDLTR